MTILHSIKELALKVDIAANLDNPAQSDDARLFKLWGLHKAGVIPDVGANDGCHGKRLVRVNIS